MGGSARYRFEHCPQVGVTRTEEQPVEISNHGWGITLEEVAIVDM